MALMELLWPGRFVKNRFFLLARSVCFHVLAYLFPVFSSISHKNFAPSLNFSGSFYEYPIVFLEVDGVVAQTGHPVQTSRIIGITPKCFGAFSSVNHVPCVNIVDIPVVRIIFYLLPGAKATLVLGDYFTFGNICFCKQTISCAGQGRGLHP